MRSAPYHPETNALVKRNPEIYAVDLCNQEVKWLGCNAALSVICLQVHAPRVHRVCLHLVSCLREKLEDPMISSETPGRVAEGELVAEYVHKFREDLKMEIAQQNLAKNQVAQKAEYDLNTCKLSFDVGDPVLVFTSYRKVQNAELLGDAF